MIRLMTYNDRAVIANEKRRKGFLLYAEGGKSLGSRGQTTVKEGEGLSTNARSQRAWRSKQIILIVLERKRPLYASRNKKDRRRRYGKTTPDR